MGEPPGPIAVIVLSLRETTIWAVSIPPVWGATGGLASVVTFAATLRFGTGLERARDPLSSHELLDWTAEPIEEHPSNQVERRVKKTT